MLELWNMDNIDAHFWSMNNNACHHLSTQVVECNPPTPFGIS